MPEAEIFRLNSAVLANRIEEIKRNPPPEILAYKASHPEFKTVACELLADYADVSVSTLKNLKLGKMTDSNCSTIWLICRAFDIDPAALLGLPMAKACNPAECSMQIHAQTARLESQCTAADQRIDALHAVIGDQREALGEAKARAHGLEVLLNEKNASIARRDKGIRMRNVLLLALSVALLAAIALVFIL